MGEPENPLRKHLPSRDSLGGDKPDSFGAATDSSTDLAIPGMLQADTNQLGDKNRKNKASRNREKQPKEVDEINIFKEPLDELPRNHLGFLPRHDGVGDCHGYLREH